MIPFAPTHGKRRRLINDTLLAAEKEHYLDCPNADFTIRAAALLLDLIFYSLASSGMHHFTEALKNSLPSLIESFSQSATPVFILGLTYVTWLIKTVVLFLYFVWTVMAFGGSPAKLLLGLRIVDAKTGDRLTYRQAALREILGKPIGWITLANPIMVLVRPDRRGLNDLFGGSSVKRIRGGQ